MVGPPQAHEWPLIGGSWQASCDGPVTAPGVNVACGCRLPASHAEVGPLKGADVIGTRWVSWCVCGQHATSRHEMGFKWSADSGVSAL